MKIGALFHVDGRSTTSLAQRMAKAQRGRDTPEPRLHDVPSGTLACIPGTDQFSNLPFVSTGSQGNILILTGTPIRTNGDLARHSQIVIESDFESATGCLSDLDGAYAAVFWHAPSERLAIVTDFLGMQPLYLAQVGGYLLIASDIRGITATGLVPLGPDEAGWGSFLSMGHFIANRTSVQNIYRAEPGTVYEYDGRAGTLQSRSYWDYPSLRNISELSQVDTGGIAAALRASVHGYLEHTDTGTVLLSGGFDSRLLLALVLEAAPTPHVVIMEHPNENNNADAEFARRVAKHYGISYERECPVREFYSSEEYVDYLVLNELATPSLYLYISQLPTFLKHEMQSVWEGIAPGAVLTPPGGDHGNNFAELAKLKCKEWDADIWKAAQHVFTPSFSTSMYEAFRSSFAQESSHYEDDGYGVSQFVVRNRMRNRTGPNPTKVYSNYVLPFTPGLTRSFFEESAGIPYQLRVRHQLYMKLYRTHYPMAAQLPFSSAGTLYAGTSGFDIHFQWIRLRCSAPYRRYTSAIARRLGYVERNRWWDEAPLIERVIGRVEDDPRLNAENIKAAKAGQFPRGFANECRALLFYWQMWKWIMDGRIMLAPTELRQSLGLFSVRARQTSATESGVAL